jgi:hypothetical protein
VLHDILQHLRVRPLRQSELLRGISQGGPRNRATAATARNPPDWDTMSLDALWQRRQEDRPTPQVTIEAIVHSVRERGLAALKEPANIERLLRCHAHARTEINRRISRLLAAKETAA